MWAETRDRAARDDSPSPRRRRRRTARRRRRPGNATARARRCAQRRPRTPPTTSPAASGGTGTGTGPDEPTNPAIARFANPAADEHEPRRVPRAPSRRPPRVRARDASPRLAAAFARFRDVDFCASRVPADAEEVPFTTPRWSACAPVGGARVAEHVLYARHRRRTRPGPSRRRRRRRAAALRGARRHHPAPTPGGCASEAAEGGGRARSCATCDGQIVGYLLLVGPLRGCALRARASAWTIRRRTSPEDAAAARGSPRTSSTAVFALQRAGAPGSC